MCVVVGSGNYFCPSSFKYLICEEPYSRAELVFFCFVKFFGLFLVFCLSFFIFGEYFCLFFLKFI